MAYNSKTNWKLNDTVTPDDLNRIEQGIKDNDTNKLAKTENAASATKLANKRTINVTGAVTGTATGFDGTENINIPVQSVDPTAMSAAVPVNKGGTGKTSITAGTVLVGNGTGTPTERAIDATVGGTANSNSLITSGAVNTALKNLAASGVAADTAVKLKTPRKIALGGAITGTGTNFDGSSDIEIPVTEVDATKLKGVVPIANGGTGATTVDGVLTNLGVAVTGNRTISVTTSGNDTSGNGTTTPYRTITKALSVIPKNLNGKNVIINVGAGTYNEIVNISDFSAGTIVINGAAGAAVNITGLTVINSNVQIDAINLNIGVSGMFLSTNALLLNASSPITVNGAATGVTLRYGARLEVSTTLTINNATTAALLVQYNSRASIRTLAGSGNGIGINVLNSIVHCQQNNIVASVATGIIAGQIYS